MKLLFFFLRVKRSISYRWHNKVVSKFIQSRFGGCGKNVMIGKGCKFVGEKNIYVGDDV